MKQVEKDFEAVMKGGKNVRESEDVYRKESSLYQNSIVVLLAGFIMALLFLFGVVVTVFAEEYDADRIVEVIYLVEGAEKAKKPFGILSVKCDGYDDCRQVCYNTVVNSFSRWQIAGSKGDFINYLSKVYAPVGAKNDPTNLNRSWEKNLRYLLGKIND